MRILVAGATGAIGRRLVPMLQAAGHEVFAMTRRPPPAGGGRPDSGATVLVADGLDRSAVRDAVLSARPDVVIHQMTALARMGNNARRFDRDFALTNRLRTEGTANLLDAALESGARRFIAQSYTGWPNERAGGPVKTETDPLDPDPPRSMRRTLRAIRELEATVTSAPDIDGLVLRYGSLYGPGTSFAPGGTHLEMVRHRRFPLVGGGTAVWSFVHIDDAARATAIAVERGAPGIYNVVDDDPAPISDWLPDLAGALCAKPPLELPRWPVRLAGGPAAASMMTELRGSSNARARAELGWEPVFPSWREGFRAALEKR